ncbi:MAG: TonB-dependent receptor, partial [Acidobacteriota bacterium]
ETISDNDELLVQAGLVYHFNDSLGLYANYSESQLPDLNNPDFSIAPPVRLGESLEAGLKYALWDNRLTGSIGYFSIDEDLEGETFRQAEATGFELDAFLRPSPQWTLAGSFAHADTEVLASSNPSDVGDPLVDEVPNKASLWGRYDFGQSTNGAGWAVGGGLVWTGKRVRPTAAAAQSVLELNGRVLRYEPVTRLDLFTTYTLPVNDTLLEFSLNLRNLTEEDNLSNVVPRVPLQGGIKPNGDPYVFDGDTEIMLGLRVRR